MFERLQNKLRSSMRPWKYTKAKRADESTNSFEWVSDQGRVPPTLGEGLEGTGALGMSAQGIASRGTTSQGNTLPLKSSLRTISEEVSPSKAGSYQENHYNREYPYNRGYPSQHLTQVLESTRISEKAPEGVHGGVHTRLSASSLPSVSEAPTDPLRCPGSLPASHPHPDLLEATLDLDLCPDSGLDQEPDSELDLGPDSELDLGPDHGGDHGLDRMAILEYGDRDQSFTWPGERSTSDKVTQAYKGQLKLAVYVNSGLLTVHIMQARHLVSKYSSTCNTYVKVGVIPDDYCNSRSKTMLVKGTNSPVYDEKFSFELMPEDLAKRVYVCVCHRDRKRQSAELLGCMSFGINNVRKKKTDVSGYFYLLAESVGRRKHLQVAPYYHDNTHYNKVNDPGTSPWEPQQASKNIRVSLERGKRGGYGFSLTGACPAIVCRVDPGGPAHIAGTRTGDYLLRVNGENVATANADCVGRIIRHSSSRVALEFLRPGAFGGDPMSSLWQPDYQDLDSSTDSEGSFASAGHTPPPRSPFWEDKENLGPRQQKEGAKRVRFQELA